MAGRGDISAGRAFVELYVKSAQFTSQLSAMSAKWSKFGADLQSMGRTIATAGAVSLLPIGLATKRFAEFDDQMRAVQAVTQASAEQLGKLTAKARQLGADTSFTAVQVGELMTELGRAGFSPDEVNAMTAAVLNLSRATGTEAKISAGIMAASLRQFQLQAGEASRVSDALTIAANKSFNTVETLGESLSYAGPVAAQFNMSIEDTLAILGGLGNVGIQGSNAGTAVRRLLTITGAEAEKLKDIFGVNFVDAAGNARPLVDTLEDVNAATKGLGTAARAAKFSEAFGLLGITGAMAIGTSTVSIRELRDALGQAGGAAQEAADKMDAGIGGAMRILTSSVEGVALAIGDALDGELRKLVKDMTGIVNVAIHWIGQNKELVVQATKFAAMLVFAGGALMGVGALLVGASAAFGVLASAAGAAFATLGVAPVVALVAIIAKLGVSIYEQVGGVKSLEDAFVALGGKAGEWKEYFAGLFSELGTTFAETWGGITDAISAGDMGLAAEVAWAGLMAVWERGTIDIRKAWNTGIFTMEATWNEFSATVSTIFLEAMTGWKIAWADMVHFFRSNWEAFAAWFGPTWNKISSVAALALNDLREATGAISPEEAAKRRDSIKAGYADTAESQAKRAAEYAATQKQIDDDHAAAVRDAMQAEAGGRQLLEDKRKEAEKGLAGDYEAQMAEADKRLADARASLDELRGQAASKSTMKAAENAAKKAKEESDAIDRWIAGGGRTGQGPGAGGGPATDRAMAVAGSFTAAGLAALGGGSGGNVQQKILNNAEKQTGSLEGIEKATQESAAASKMLEMGLQS